MKLTNAKSSWAWIPPNWICLCFNMISLLMAKFFPDRISFHIQIKMLTEVPLLLFFLINSSFHLSCLQFSYTLLLLYVGGVLLVSLSCVWLYNYRMWYRWETGILFMVLQSNSLNIPIIGIWLHLCLIFDLKNKLVLSIIVYDYEYDPSESCSFKDAIPVCDLIKSSSP